MRERERESDNIASEERESEIVTKEQVRERERVSDGNINRVSK